MGKAEGQSKIGEASSLSDITTSLSGITTRLDALEAKIDAILTSKGGTDSARVRCV